MQSGALAATDPLMGSLVRIKLNRVVYTGIVQRIDRSGNPYVSIRVCSDGSSSKLSRPGKTMDFYGDELNKLELVVPEKDVPAGLKKPAAPRTVPSIPVTMPLHRAPASTAEDREWEACRSSTFEPAHRPVSKAEWLQRLREEPARPIRPAANSHRPTAMDADYTYVSELGETFKGVMLTLAESATVGVMCQGKTVGRSGDVSLVAMSCRKGVYLFDLAQIGVSEAMEAGLKEILESSHVLKVVHDCRRLSDYLFHKLNISIVNVFDTQAADWMIRRAEAGGMVPIHVNSLRFCLQRYLQLYMQEVRFYETMADALVEDEEVWMKRPVQSYLLDCACRSVHYLPELHGVMLQALLAEFVQAVDIYLGAMRDLPQDAPPENADVLPRLRCEFAINAGRRNFAAPGRATSPERDGLHHVPRCDTDPARDREVLDQFFRSHHNRHGDEPVHLTSSAEADAESFPFRPSGSRVRTSDFDFPDSNAGSDAEFDDGDDCREPSVGFGDPVPAVRNDCSEPNVRFGDPVPAERDPPAHIPCGDSPPVVVVRHGPSVSDLGTDLDSPMPLLPAPPSQSTPSNAASRGSGSFSSSTSNASSASFATANKTAVRPISSIGTSVDAPPPVAQAANTSSSTQANRFDSSAGRGDYPSSGESHTGSSARVGTAHVSTAGDSGPRAAPAVHSRRANPPRAAGTKKTSFLPLGVLPLSAMTYQPQAESERQADADGNRASEWRPNRAALDASWDNFTGRKQTIPKAVIMGIGTSGLGNSDSSDAVSPAAAVHSSAHSSDAVSPAVNDSAQSHSRIATSGRGSALRNASSSVSPQGSAQGKVMGRGQMLAAVNANRPGR